MSTTHSHLEQPRTPTADAGVRCDRAAHQAGSLIDWPELKLPPINLYNVQRLSANTHQKSPHLRD